MTDTIELLETIGSDASLRYAAADELKGVLERAKAGAELTMAAASGDGAPLRQMLWDNEVVQWVPQSVQTNAIAFLESDWSKPSV
jgi:hypothetical protein